MECHTQLSYFQHNLLDDIVSKIQPCQIIAYLPLFGHGMDSLTTDYITHVATNTCEATVYFKTSIVYVRKTSITKRNVYRKFIFKYLSLII